MKQIIISAALVMLAAQAAPGQVLKTYSGMYEGGQATYTYYEDENGERVKHGKFTYDRTDEGTGIGRGMIGGNISYTDTQHASGNYKNGMKDGEWTYKHKTAGGGIAFSDFSAVVNYAEGRMEGTLSSKEGTFQMKGNRITGQVRKSKKTRNEDWTISGQFDDEGFPDGTWTKHYQSNGNLYADTEKYVHGLLILKQTKNESTGEISRHEFEGVDPQEYLAAHVPGKDSAIVDKQICQERTFFKQGEEHHSYLEDGMLPEIFGVGVRTIVEKIKEEKGFGEGQDTYEGIPFKEIAVIGKIEAPDEGEIFQIVEQMPQFPGGKEAMDKYLKEELNYPPLAASQGIQGRVMVQFVVNRDGSISDARIVRGLDDLCDKEALRLVNNMPEWTPGKSGNKNVRVSYTLSVTFKSPQ